MRLRSFLALVAVVVVALGALGAVMYWRARTGDADTVAQLLQATEQVTAVAAGDGTAADAAGGPAPSEPVVTGAQEDTAARTAVDGTVPDGIAALAYPELLEPPEAAAPVRPAPTPFAEDLADRLEAIASAPGLEIDSPFGIAVLDSWGREVFTLGADRPVVPASTNKLVVAAAALRTFHPEQRFRTVVAATAEPDGDGVVDGDLVIIGGGDPTLASPRFITEIYPARPATPIADLAAAVEDAGVTRVTGRILAAPGFIPHDLEQQGLKDSYFDRLEATRTSGLSVNMGRRMFVRERDDALLGVVASDPAVETAAVLAAQLDERDITVEGDPELLPQDAVAPEVEVLAEIESPPLSEMLTHMVRRSDNNVADTLFRTIGALHSDGSWGGSSRAVRRVLAPLELDWTGVQLSDGSGLARTDRLTARFLARLDEEMMASPQAAQWRSFMAVAGESGTLQQRYRGTPADGTLYGKTGALRDVRSLAGFVDGPAEENDTPYRYHFAVVGSDLDAEEIGRARRVMDLVVLTLAAQQHGCDGWTPAAPQDGDGAPEDLVCP